ncbi:HD domain-containing protein [Mobilitalea sibirica]|uniref:HD domain-containing protein n=1 Tax=Mobilitalea sibirica TaxID=1462919 RepID=A0A8J7H2S0_9FIRM|nr:HD domain-containing phosphohydrolase [Mobilitalea sibirica]MBH1941174.1 HD domain-containing protein [Mobilitalea sibirica]
MDTQHILSLRPIKKIGITILITIILIIICFIILQKQINKKEYEDKLIINIFGRQRMYTQMISKDASRLYVLLEAFDADRRYQTLEEIQNKIISVKADLIQAKIEFTNIHKAMIEGHLSIDSYGVDINRSIEEASDYLLELDDLWNEFQNAIDTIVSATHINYDMAKALIYINENNLQLLNLCEQIQEIILKDSIQSARYSEYTVYGLIGLLSAVAIFALSQLLKFIVLPFTQLYKGISQIGLTKSTINPSFPTKKKVTPMVNEINEIFSKINNLISLIENMNNNSSFNESLDFINRTFSAFIPYNYIGIALIEGEVFRASYGVSDGTINGLPDKILGSTWPINETSLEKLLQTGEARIINDLEQYTAGKPIKPYNQTILNAGIKASITLPLKVSGSPVGMIFFSSNQKNVYTNDHLNFLKTLVNSIAISLNQNIFINDLIFSSILALAKLAEARDEDTGEHLDQMKVYSRVIAELLYENKVYPGEITPEYFEKIERFSPLHDIGKVGVRDGILLKPGKLTKKEFDEMKLHTEYGAKVLRAAELNMVKKGKSLFGIGIEIAEGHHEKWDGSGYPYGKKGHDIPLSARIVAVADVLDALTSKRPYKEAFSFETAMKIIEEGRGKHFDPAIIDVILSNRDRIESYYKKFHSKHK